MKVCLVKDERKRKGEAKAFLDPVAVNWKKNLIIDNERMNTTCTETLFHVHILYVQRILERTFNKCIYTLKRSSCKQK